MTYIKSVITQEKNSPDLDAFSRKRVSNPGNRFDVEFVYDKQSDIMDEVTNGSGTVTHNSNSRDLTLATGGTGVGDNAAMYSYNTPYTPGCSQLIAITGTLNSASIGGGVTQIFIRSNVTGSVVETTYNQADWSYEGNNTYNSHSDVDWTTSQIFEMDFQSLKVGRIRFYLNRNGVIIPVHEIFNDNVRVGGYWQLPSQPLTWRIYNDATYTYMEVCYGDANNAIGFRHRISVNATATLRAICGTVKSEGGLDLHDMPGFPASTSNVTTPITVSTTIIPVLSVRARSTFNSITNRTLFISVEYSIQTDNPILVLLYHNNTLTGASWANVDTNNSAMEKDVSASALSSGHVFHTEYIAGTKNINTSSRGALGRAILWLPRNGNSGIITLAAVRTSATNASVLASLKWGEVR